MGGKRISFDTTKYVDPVIIDKNGQRASWGKWGLATVGSHTVESL